MHLAILLLVFVLLVCQAHEDKEEAQCEDPSIVQEEEYYEMWDDGDEDVDLRPERVWDIGCEP